ncbi:MAG: maleylpyruvate isomerase N-terminal domain-containing protein [Gordonia sp. (in: high G+C Gram-positive bacteria)]
MRDTISRFDYIDAARTLGEQFARLVDDARSPDVRLRTRRGWTLTDCVGHLASEPARYLALARGDDEWPAQPRDLADIYAKQIANLPTRDIRVLSRSLRSDLDELLDVVAHFGARVPRMRVAGNHNQTIRADAALGILIADFAICGRDVSRALGTPWHFDATAAPLVIRGCHQLLDVWSRESRCDNHTATYAITIRGTDERVVYEFTDGALEIDPAEPRPPDVHISADPSVVLLSLYDRLSPAWTVLSGQATPWGRRPWLGIGLHQRLAAAQGRRH